MNPISTFSAAACGGGPRLDVADHHTSHTDIVELRDFMDVHLRQLSAEEQRAVYARTNGSTFQQIAFAERITRQAAHHRYASGIGRLRQLVTGA